ncbi:hypothetical protein GGF46_004822 [Coemansia sp. RSA 552]|nr:hypothetical protein GGF46_004822 [Coemansia sp. RSA 552]
MAKSPLKGADAFIVQRRPALRATAYLTICLMSLVNMAMLSSSWGNARFMRENGAFTGSFVVTSSVVTMVVSGMYAAATIMCMRAQARDTLEPKLCQRLASDGVERMVCCLMTTWWLSMALGVSNMAFVFRDEIRRCVNHRLPRRVLGVSPDVAATACIVFRGSLVLSWLIWAMWIGRTWRAFTRSDMHFDSSIFKEHSASAIDLGAVKPMGTHLVNPDTFSPRDPTAHTAKPESDLDSDCESQAAPRIPYRQPATNACRCAGCPMAKPELAPKYIVRPMADPPVSAPRPGAPQSRRVHARPPQGKPAPHSDTCCPPTVGTATLITEPLHVQR